MGKGAWWATVHGVSRVGHDLATKQPPQPDRVSEELWTDIHDIIQEAVIKKIPKKKKLNKAKHVSEEALQTAMKRREVKGKGEKKK